MTRLQWVAVGGAGIPVLAGSVIVSATFGPLGAIAFAGLLLAGLNAHHLFHAHKEDRQ